eukprot:SAG31_NODE_12127_length_966_cov_0.955017_2_plen_84_part_00
MTDEPADAPDGAAAGGSADTTATETVPPKRKGPLYLGAGKDFGRAAPRQTGFSDAPDVAMPPTHRRGTGSGAGQEQGVGGDLV